MKTVIYGPVTEEHLALAELMAGITPTSYLSNGSSIPPASNREVFVIPQCPKVPDEAGERQNHWRLCIQADAAILIGAPEHLVYAATQSGLLLFEVER
ncbi:hypothetical protein [Comamonas sp.]|uniref:hypothetical protein n=1 Tax=Comamonas sp. TaxID=34028 RepID=UPI0028AE8D2A|nr:hypothetical protein [Comamonas sp.]